MLIPKSGDIKVDSGDLLHLMEMIEKYQSVVFNNPNMLSEHDKEYVENNYSFYINFIDKYIVTSSLRRKEHLWFTLLKSLENKEYTIVDKDIIKSKEICDISIYMDYISEEIEREQSINNAIKMFTGLAVAIFGEDRIRREVWGYYLEVKAKREEVVRRINRINLD